MRVSLNELKSVSCKAALGCGVSTGAAEDLGKAAAWLAVRGLPALGSVLAALGAVDEGRAEYGRACFDSGGADWRSTAAASDLSAAWLGATPAALFVSLAVKNEAAILRMLSVDVPMLQVPHFAAAASSHDLSLRVNWRAGRSEMCVECGPGEVFVSDIVQPSGERARNMAVGVFPPGLGQPNGHRLLDADLEQEIFHSGYEVDNKGWQRLCLYAARILVAATGHSRVLGAGAGLIDND